MSFFSKLFHKVRKFATVTDARKTKLPERSTKHSAGYDLYLPQRIVVRPKRWTEPIKLDIKVYTHNDEFLMVVPRSSIGFKNHLMMVNTVGIIDADYVDNPQNEGNIGIAFYNYGDNTVVLEKGTKVAQGIIIKYQVVDDDHVTVKREGGTGSTGR